MYSVRGTNLDGPFLRLMVRSVSGGPARVLIDGVSAATVDNGTLIYQKGSELRVADLNLSTLALSNDRRLLDGVAPMVNTTAAGWALSGDLLVYRAAAGATRSLAWVNRDGRAQPLAAPARSYMGLGLSPDGNRVLLGVQDEPRRDVLLYDLTQDVLTPISTDGQSEGGIWAPDGRHIATYRRGVGDHAVVRLTPDGTGPPDVLTRSDRFLWPASQTKDGRHLVVMDNGSISMVDLLGDRSRRPLVSGPGFKLGGRLSPDERWLAYFSKVTGKDELYVTAFPQAGPSWRLSRGGAREAVWSRDGRELFFRSEDGRRLLSIAVKPGPPFRWSTPRLLFEGDQFADGGAGQVNYDVSLDGTKFLMLTPVGTDNGQLNVVQGWRELLPPGGRR